MSNPAVGSIDAANSVHSNMQMQGNGGHGSEPTDLGGGGQVFEPSTTDHVNSAYGTKLSSGNVQVLAEKMGIDYESKLNEIKGTSEAFLDGKVPADIEAGANLVLNSGMQAMALGMDSEGNLPEGMSPEQYLQNSATAAKLAYAKDAQGLEQFMNEIGGNEAGLSGEELVALFEVGGHMYNHPILNSISGNDPALNTNTGGVQFNGHDYFQITHLTSTNSAPGSWAADKEAGTMGMYNDGGEYPQLGTAQAGVDAVSRAVQKMALG
jgi:hypothetical protein